MGKQRPYGYMLEPEWDKDPLDPEDQVISRPSSATKDASGEAQKPMAQSKAS